MALLVLSITCLAYIMGCFITEVSLILVLTPSNIAQNVISIGRFWQLKSGKGLRLTSGRYIPDKNVYGHNHNIQYCCRLERLEPKVSMSYCIILSISVWLYLLISQDINVTKITAQ